MLDIEVKLYSFHFSRPYIDGCIKIVFKNFLNFFFLKKKQNFQINNNNSFLIDILSSTQSFLIDIGKKYDILFSKCCVQNQVRK